MQLHSVGVQCPQQYSCLTGDSLPALTCGVLPYVILLRPQHVIRHELRHQTPRSLHMLLKSLILKPQLRTQIKDVLVGAVLDEVRTPRNMPYTMRSDDSSLDALEHSVDVAAVQNSLAHMSMPHHPTRPARRAQANSPSMSLLTCTTYQHASSFDAPSTSPAFNPCQCLLACIMSSKSSTSAIFKTHFKLVSTDKG